MKANPGGQIDLNEMVGREQLIDDIWQTLAQQSIRLVAERRIGKTTVIKKLAQQPRNNSLAIYQDLEKCHSALDFAYMVYRDVETFLSKRARAWHKASSLLKACGGLEVGGIFKLPTTERTVHWKDLLFSTLEDLVEEQHAAQQLTVMLWDELPFMLLNIKSREGEKVAMEVLDTLRSLRQTLAEKGLRMVLTGSIGLHHVISQLKQQSYANAPLNDTFAMPVPTLSMAAATELAQKLLSGEAITCTDMPTTTEEIARLSDQFPFYIHHIVKALKLSGLTASPEHVRQIVLRQLTDANDPWELNHYQERIADYYGQDNRSAVLAILDSAAVAEQNISISQLLNELKTLGALSDREQLLQLLKLIEQDHYLSRNDQGAYAFQFPLLQKWWKLSRGL